MRLTQSLMKMKTKEIKAVVIFVYMFVLSACLSDKTSECLINYSSEFKTINPPVIYITGVDSIKRDRCIYSIKLNVWFRDYQLVSSGKLYSDSNAFYLKSIDPETEYVKYFDFSKSVGDQYDISLSINRRNYLINVFLDKIVNTKNMNKVHVFRFKDTFYNEDKAYDTVILASMEEGIIGSYFSSCYNDLEYMLAPSGDILNIIPLLV